LVVFALSTVVIFFHGSANIALLVVFIAAVGMAYTLVLISRPRPRLVTAAPAAPAGPAPIEPIEPIEPIAPVTPVMPVIEASGERRYFVPFELPPTPVFVGRDEALQRAVAAIRSRPAAGPSIVAIYGDPGVGKTAFAIKAAHQAASAFGDGALYADLGAQANDPDGIAAVLGDFVDSLQGPEGVPEGLAARRARFDELTADGARGRVLIVLDAAQSVEQVRALLPTGAGSAVVVTSRTPLDLGATEVIALDPLSPDESQTLFRTLIGAERLAEPREAAAATTIVERAAGYPLALHLAASSLSSRRSLSLQTAVETMRRLASTGSRSPGSTALDFTYAMLTADERDAIRAIGLLDTQTFAAWMVAAMLTAAPEVEARSRPESADRAVTPEKLAWRLCERLVDLRLLEHLTDDATGVAAFRVLEHVHTYAAARAQREWGPDGCGAVVQALRDYQAGREPLDVTDLRGILRDTVYRNLDQGRISSALNHARGSIERAREDVAAARAAAAVEPTPPAVLYQLQGALENEGLALAALAEVLAELGGVDDALDVAGKALENRTPLASPRAQRIQGKLLRRLRRFDEAIVALSEARAGAVAAADPGEELRVLRELTMVYATAGRTEEALATIDEAFELARAADPDNWLRPSLLWVRAVAQRDAVQRGARPRDLLDVADRELREANKFAESHRQLLWRAWAGYERAQVMRAKGQLDLCRVLALRALQDFTEMRHRYGTARCRLELGRSYLDQNRPADALPVLEEARETFSTFDERWIEAEAAADLARAQRGAQRPASAERELRVALEGYDAARDERRRAEIDRELAELRESAAGDLSAVMT
jgi:tetratricopeptide (TPR) repeat protein